MPVYRKIAFLFFPFFPWSARGQWPLYTPIGRRRRRRYAALPKRGRENLRGHIIQRQSVPKIAEICHMYFIRGHVINLLFLFAMGTWALHTNIFFSFLRFFVRSLFGNILSQRGLSLFIMVRRLRKSKEGPSPPPPPPPPPPSPPPPPPQSLVRCPLGPVEKPNQTLHEHIN